MLHGTAQFYDPALGFNAHRQPRGEGTRPEQEHRHPARDDSQDPLRAIPNNVTNIGNVNINQRFDRDISPDRVAFSVQSQLEKLRARKPHIRPGVGY